MSTEKTIQFGYRTPEVVQRQAERAGYSCDLHQARRLIEEVIEEWDSYGDPNDPDDVHAFNSTDFWEHRFHITLEEAEG